MISNLIVLWQTKKPYSIQEKKREKSVYDKDEKRGIILFENTGGLLT